MKDELFAELVESVREAGALCAVSKNRHEPLWWKTRSKKYP
jgi:hypothetical protein